MNMIHREQGVKVVMMLGEHLQDSDGTLTSKKTHWKSSLKNPLKIFRPMHPLPTAVGREVLPQRVLCTWDPPRRGQTRRWMLLGAVGCS